MESTMSSEVIRTTTYLKDANIIGYLAVFGLVNIPIWLLWVGTKFGAYKTKKELKK